MAFLNAENQRLLNAVSNLLFSNPFLPDILVYEQEALGEHAVEEEPTWSMDVSDPERARANTWRVIERLKPLLKSLRESLAAGENAREADLILYEDALLYFLYYRYYQHLVTATFQSQGKDKSRWSFFRDFCEDWNYFFHISGVTLPSDHQANHTFACYYQIVRAFHHIFEQIIGNSRPAARLRAAIWQSR